MKSIRETFVDLCVVIVGLGLLALLFTHAAFGAPDPDRLLVKFAADAHLDMPFIQPEAREWPINQQDSHEYNHVL